MNVAVVSCQMDLISEPNLNRTASILHKPPPGIKLHTLLHTNIYTNVLSVVCT
jgi:hypothetical protein